MGFGILMIGYFFANVMSLYSTLSLAMLAGYPLMIWGLRRLAPYHARLRYTYYAAYAALPFAVYFSVFSIMQWCHADWGFFAVTHTAVEWCYFAFTLALHFLLLYGLAGLAGELGLVSVQSAAWRNVIMMALYAVIDLVSRLPIPWITANAGYFTAPVLLLKILFLLLNMWLLFQCYRKIAPEEEVFPQLVPEAEEADEEGKEDDA